MAGDDKRRAPSQHDRDRRRSDSAGVVVSVIPHEPTPPPTKLPALPAVGRTPTPDEVRRLEAKVNELVEAVGEVWDARHVMRQLDRMVHVTDKLDDRLDKYAERVVHAEAIATSAWDAAKATMPKLDAILQQLGETKRLAAGVEKLADKLESNDTRLAAIETEQRLAADRFDLHDKRDQEMQQTLGRVENRVAALETARALDDNTAKVKKQVARLRPWWFSAKGVGAVVAAVAAAVATIVAATNGGCT